MDLSQLSTEDLKALQGGDISKVSTAGLQTLRGAPAPAAEPSALERVGNAVKSSLPYGAADIAGSGAANLLTKIGGGLHGLYKLATGQGADAAADAVNADAEQYHTEANSPGAQTIQKGLGYVAKPFEAVAAPLDRAIAGAGPGISTAVPAVSEGIQDVASILPVGKFAQAAVDASRAAKVAGAAAGGVEGAAKPVVGTGANAIETGRAAGAKFTPAAVESRQPGAALAGDIPKPLTGVSLEDRRAINLHNQDWSTQKAGETLGLKSATDLPKKAFEDAKQPHFDTYKETGDTLGPGLTGSQNFTDTLEGLLADTSPTQLKGAAVPQTNRILNAAKSGNLSGPQMVKDMSWLRANGGKSVAKALEGEMETQLAATPAGSQQLGKFQDARTGLAQINTLQEATKGGQLDAGKLAELDQKYPNLLTGNLKLIAQSAAAAPQDFRLPSGIAPGSSPVSKGLLQQVPLVGTGAHMALKVGEKALGYAGKKLAPSLFDPTSDAFQNRFGRAASPTEASYFQDFGKRPAAPSKAFELAPSPGTAGGVAQREMGLPQGNYQPAPGLQLAHPEGEVGVNPTQLGMQLAQGRAAAPGIELAPSPGELGEAPSRQLGMEIAQGRPLEDQKLALKPTEGTIEPHQPSLLGHEGTPEGGSRGKPKAKKRVKD